jgi:osmotically-inducible protein OsmY
LWEIDALRTAGRWPTIKVEPGGRVELSGPVRSRLIRDQLRETVAAVPGVGEVIDRMVADPELEVAAAAALQKDPRTSSLPPGSVLVRSGYGAVTLTGQLPEGADRRALLEVVRAVPGVRQVYDRLTESLRHP